MSICEDFWNWLTMSPLSMQNEYSPEWDAYVRRQIALGAVSREDWATAKVGNKSIWLENYPYGFGSPYGERGKELNIRPSRTTIKRLRNHLREVAMHEFFGRV